jgi:hypothetical protein
MTVYAIEMRYPGEDWIEVTRAISENEAQRKYELKRAFTAPEVEVRIRKLDPSFG